MSTWKPGGLGVSHSPFLAVGPSSLVSLYLSVVWGAAPTSQVTSELEAVSKALAQTTH